jgi:DNA-binding NarL/FixJ family response regulator
MSRPPEPPKSRVMIVEDHPMFRERLADLINLEPDMEVCAEADNIRDGFELARKSEADVGVVDITLKGSSGLELVKNLAAAKVNLPVLVLSMHEESLYAERALRAGARGYITKHEASANIMIALRQVLRGEIFLSASASTKILSNFSRSRQSAAPGVERLTDRELEVFQLIGRGHATREIGIRLSLGSATIETYRARIKEKLGLENALQLQQEATRWLDRTTLAASAV